MALVPNTIKGRVLGARGPKYWVLALVGSFNDGSHMAVSVN